MYLHAWKRGLKTTYYLSSRLVTKINKATVSAVAGGTTPSGPGGGAPEPKKSYIEEEAIACSLENPKACEAGD